MANSITLTGDYGAYKGSVWRGEAELQFNSFKKLYSSACEDRLELNEYVSDIHKNLKRVDELIKNIKAYRKSSVLLLCYAIELGLKSCALPLLLNMPKKNALNKIKKFGHNFESICNFVNLELTHEDRVCLKYLSSYVRDYGRYPFEAETSVGFIKLENELNSYISDADFIARGEGIFERIYKYSKDIQGSSEFPASHSTINFNDWIIVLRESGVASPRLTVHAPNVTGDIAVTDVFKILEEFDEDHSYFMKRIIANIGIDRVYKVK
jgi:hypothetical protein